MIKNILVPLTGSSSDAPALKTALAAAEAFSARLQAVHFRPGPGQIVQAAALGQFGSNLGTVELIHALQKTAAERSIAARATYEGQRAGAMADFSDTEGDEVERVISEGRDHDLVVLGRGEKTGKYTPAEIGHILVSCGRPILLAPAEPSANLLQGVAIAWKETAEAARAVTAAMPFLAKAGRVTVLSGAEEESGVADKSASYLATQLTAHGIAAEAEAIALGGKPAHTAVLERAGALGAGLLVMGGYGHSRRREWVFGGFTREVLREARLPVLLVH
jgi:nucleotide-binding universal stress UspA family protein